MLGHNGPAPLDNSLCNEGRIGRRDGYATISADGYNLTLSSERQALSLQSFVVNLPKRHD